MEFGFWNLEFTVSIEQCNRLFFSIKRGPILIAIRRNDWANSITTTPRGGFILTGYYGSNDGDTKAMNNVEQYSFIIKLNYNGNRNPSTSINKYSESISYFSTAPNPLITLSTISNSLDKPSHVRIEVVNSIGEAASVLSDRQEDVG